MTKVFDKLHWYLIESLYLRTERSILLVLMSILVITSDAANQQFCAILYTTLILQSL